MERSERLLAAADFNATFNEVGRKLSLTTSMMRWSDMPKMTCMAWEALDAGRAEAS